MSQLPSNNSSSHFSSVSSGLYETCGMRKTRSFFSQLEYLTKIEKQSFTSIQFIVCDYIVKIKLCLVHTLMTKAEQPDISQLIYSQLSDCLEQLSIICQNQDSQQELTCLGQIASLYEQLCQFSHALDYYQQLFALAWQINDPEWQEIALYNMGNCYLHLSLSNESIHFFTQLLELTRKTGNRVMQVAAMWGLGSNYYNLGKYHQAIEYFQNQLAISCEINECSWQQSALTALGNIYQLLGQYEQAINHTQQALKLAIQLNDIKIQSVSLGNLGNLYLQLENWEQSREIYSQSLAIAQKIDDKHLLMISYYNLGKVYKHQGEYQQAENYLTKALEISQHMDEKQVRPSILQSLSDVYFHDQSIERIERAIDFSTMSLEICRQANNQFGEATALSQIGTIYKCTGKYEQSLKYYYKALIIFQNIEIKPSQQQIFFNIGEVYYLKQEYFLAMESFRSALTLAEEVSQPDKQAASALGVAASFHKLNCYTDAIPYYNQAYKLYTMLGDNNQAQQMWNTMQKLASLKG